MTSKSISPMHIIIKLIPFGLILAVIVVAVGVFKLFPPQSAKAELGWLTAANGEVKISNGVSETEARVGSLQARQPQTLLKTGNGKAEVKLQNGAYFLIDPTTIVEFNIDNRAGKQAYIFNLVKGKVLVVSTSGDSTSIQVFIGGALTAQISSAVMGIEVQLDPEVIKRIDCLSGNCLVNGTALLRSGQRAQEQPDNSLSVTNDLPYADWLTFGNDGKTNPTIANLLADFLPTITPSMTPSETPTILSPIFPTVSSNAPITVSATPTPSRTPRTFLPSWTPVPNNNPVPPFTATPAGRLIPSPTLTLIPSSTPTLTIFPTYTPTLNSIPSPTWTNTTIQIPTPTNTPAPTDAPTPTRTHPSKHTDIPTNTPVPTETDMPSPTLTSIPTETSIPTDNPVPTEYATPTEAVTPPPPPL